MPEPTEPAETITTHVDSRGRPVRPIRSARLTVQGIAPRCRKVDRHHVDLGRMLPVDVDVDALETEARACLGDYKNIQSAILYVNYGELSADGFATYSLMDSRHIARRLV